jgi:hypothetical protein
MLLSMRSSPSRLRRVMPIVSRSRTRTDVQRGAAETGSASTQVLSTAKALQHAAEGRSRRIPADSARGLSPRDVQGPAALRRRRAADPIAAARMPSQSRKGRASPRQPRRLRRRSWRFLCWCRAACGEHATSCSGPIKLERQRLDQQSGSSRELGLKKPCDPINRIRRHRIGVGEIKAVGFARVGHEFGLGAG